MPRANRHFLQDHVWHITHRCHKKEFLLKFIKDRKCWRHWLFESKKRYGLSVLNFIITSNHIHLLVLDQGKEEISRSMQLIAGRTAQEYNQRKNRKGAFWEDRYHATAIDTEDYLARCMTYIDLNRVRAGVVSAPEDWCWSGYHETLHTPQRYAVIGILALPGLSGAENLRQYQEVRKIQVESVLKAESILRESIWTQALAVGSQKYIETVQGVLANKAKYRSVLEDNDMYALKEPVSPYKVDFTAKK